MKLSSIFNTFSVSLIAALPLAVCYPQTFSRSSGANDLLGLDQANDTPRAPQQPSTELQPPNCGAGMLLLDGECVKQGQSPESSIETNKTSATPSAEDPTKTRCDELSLDKEATNSEPVDPDFAHPVPVSEGPLNFEGFSKAGCDNMHTFLSAEDFATTRCDEFSLDKNATNSEPVDPGFARPIPVPEGPLNSQGFSKAGCDNIRKFLSAEDFATTRCDEFDNKATE